MDELAEWARAFDISLTVDQLEQFATYETLLLEWNDRMSLTAIRSQREIRIRHFLDSLTCAAATGSLEGRSLIDIGSGAGFPGLPLKILYPGLDLMLVDSVAKKARFLEHVAGKLGLVGVKVIVGRAESMGQNRAYREQFDWAVGRAVAEMRILAEYLLPLCRLGGSMLAQKGEGAIEEVAAAAKAIDVLGGGAARLTAVHLPEVNQTHYLVVVEKIAATDSRYPRQPGIPAKRPL
jgi:16S rRNA (guanine527-N7)-methyltransferase